MALGIGATTLLFSVAYGVLLKPLPWSDATQLVRVTETREGRTGRVLGTVSNGTFLAWRWLAYDCCRHFCTASARTTGRRSLPSRS